MEVKQKKFKGQHFYIGIDVHLKKWSVTILNSEMELKTFSQESGAGILIKHLNKNYPGGDFHLVYETGFCGFESCRAFLEAGFDAIVVHATDVPTSGKARTFKTDKTDSRKLALSLRSGMLKGVHVPSRKLESDRDLVRQRIILVKEFAAFKNRIKSLLMKQGIPIPEKIKDHATRNWSKNYLQWLKEIQFNQPAHRLVLDNYMEIGNSFKEQIKKVEAQLRELDKEPVYSEEIEILRSVPGFGRTIAREFCLQIGNVDRFKRIEDLCSYVGLVPTLHASGDHEYVGSLTRRGNKKLKSGIIEAAWTAVRTDPELTYRFTKLCGHMKSNKAIIRIARNLLSRIRHLLTTRSLYQMNYN